MRDARTGGPAQSAGSGEGIEVDVVTGGEPANSTGEATPALGPGWVGGRLTCSRMDMLWLPTRQEPWLDGCANRRRTIGAVVAADRPRRAPSTGTSAKPAASAGRARVAHRWLPP